MKTTRLEWIFLSLILILFIIRCSHGFFTQFQPEVVQEEYLEYIQRGERSRALGSFSDNKLYAHVGWLYIHGLSPDIINFEHPPLAKYLIGLSELVFMNEVILTVIFSVLTLLLVYFITRKITVAFPFVLFPTLILSLDIMYIRFSSTSMLDIYATFFVTLSIFLLISDDNKWAPPLLYVAIGLALSCKWITVFLLVLPPLYYVLKKEYRRLTYYPLYMIIAVLTYIATYAVFFLVGNNIHDFIGLQFRMLEFHQELRLLSGAPPPLWILLNFLLGIEGPSQIQTLYINTQNMTVTFSQPQTGLSLINSYNPLTWPISFSATIMCIFYSIKRDRRVTIIPLTFLLLITLIARGKPFIWYLLPGLPFAFISLAYVINRFYDDSMKTGLAKAILILYLASIFLWSLLANLPQYIVT
jgi:hypothetical protein